MLSEPVEIARTSRLITFLGVAVLLASAAPAHGQRGTSAHGYHLVAPAIDTLPGNPHGRSLPHPSGARYVEDPETLWGLVRAGGEVVRAELAEGP